jgi:hypothetical protein
VAPKPAPAAGEDATINIRAPAPQAAPQPVPPAVTPLPPSPPIRPPEAPAPRGSRLPLLLGLLVLLLGAGAAGWWIISEQPAMPAPLATPATPAVDPTEAASPAEIAAMRLPPARVLEIAQRRQATARPQDALLLFELAAEQNFAPALSALARLYDPASFAPGGALSAANPVKAAELWRAAERAGDASAAAPRAALRQRLEAAARSGDSLADLALRDFWP